MNYLSKIFQILLVITPLQHFSQGVAINTNGVDPNTNAMLDIDVSSNNKGILIPRITTAQRNAMGGLGGSEEGLTVYDETTNSYWLWDGTQWVQFLMQGKAWELTGNSGTTPGTHFIGTLDAQDFIVKTNGAERLRVEAAGNVGIGTPAPVSRFHVSGGRVEFTATTDANGTAGSGVLEIANSLRIDGNEIITNTNSTLYIQNDNNGDLRVDNNTLMVDASKDNVGIGTTAPDTRLDVNGAGTFRPSASVNITADNTSVTIGNRSYVKVTSNSSNYLTRRITFTDGLEAGQMLILEYASTNSNKLMIENGVLLDDGTGIVSLVNNAIVLSGESGYYKVVRFVWNGTDWLQEGIGSSGKAIFDHTGSNQAWTVPAGVYTIQAKLWGAGGGGSGAGNRASGGGGAFINGKISVTPGENLTIIVGGGGTDNGLSAFGGGGKGGSTDSGGGGGRSAIQRGASELVTAGAGGGACESANGDKNGHGGYGAVTNGQDGGYERDDCAQAIQRGHGGTQASGGAGGTDPDCSWLDDGIEHGAPGGLHYGGNTNTDYFDGGAGGSGYYGGGAGASDDAGGGGGGSSYRGGYYTNIGSANGTSNSTGAAATAGGTADSDYSNNAGRGGASNAAGNPGRVVIIW